MRITFQHWAGEHERFAPEAFVANVGKQVPLVVESATGPGMLRVGIHNSVVDYSTSAIAALGTVVAAEVASDGRSVCLTVEIGELDR